MAGDAVRAARGAGRVSVPEEEMAGAERCVQSDLRGRGRGQCSDDDGGESGRVCGGVGWTEGARAGDRGILFRYVFVPSRRRRRRRRGFSLSPGILYVCVS